MENQTWQERFNNSVLAETQYSGQRQPGDKQISASSLGNEVQYVMMQKIVGKSSVKSEMDASTIGSVYQLGIDGIFKDDKEYEYAIRMEHMLPNGWLVSGEFDLLDLTTNTIIDCKVLSDSGYKNTVKDKDNPDGSYNLQLGVYKYLLWKTRGKKFEGGLSVFNKGGSKNKGNIFLNIDIETHDPEDIEDLLIQKTNDVERAEQEGLDETEWCNIYKFGTSRGSPARCNLYCDYSIECKTHQKNSQSNIKNFVGSLDLDKSIKESNRANSIKDLYKNDSNF